MAGKIIVKNACVREPGYLYYISREGDLCRSEMVHSGRKKGSGKKKKEKAAKPTKASKSSKKKKK